MYKFLFMSVSFLVVSSVAFSADNIDYNKPFDEIKEQVSEFDQRHSLMPVEAKPVKKNVTENQGSIVIPKSESENKVKESQSLKDESKDLLLKEKKNDDTKVDDKITNSDNKKSEVIKIEKDKTISEQKISVEKTIKPVYVVPPAFPDEDKKAIEDAKMYLKQNSDLKDMDKTLSTSDDKNEDIVSDVKPEENTLSQEKLENTDDKSVAEKSENSEPFVLKQIPPKKYDGSDIIFSNVIEEKAGTMENHPLIINKNKVGEKNNLLTSGNVENISNPTRTQSKFLTPSEALVPTKPTVMEPIATSVENNTDFVTKEQPKSLISGSMNIDNVSNEKNFSQKTSFEKKNKSNLVSEREKIINSIPTIERDVLTAHIASYTTEETAKRGIEIWKEKYPLITILHPFIKYENVEGKGMFYRVFVKGSEAKLENLCNQMKSNSDWCNIIR